MLEFVECGGELERVVWEGGKRAVGALECLDLVGEFVGIVGT